MAPSEPVGPHQRDRQVDEEPGGDAEAEEDVEHGRAPQKAPKTRVASISAAKLPVPRAM